MYVEYKNTNTNFNRHVFLVEVAKVLGYDPSSNQDVFFSADKSGNIHTVSVIVEINAEIKSVCGQFGLVRK